MYWFCHWLESYMGVHVVPILKPLSPPSPSHPSGSSQCTSPEHPVSCIEPGLAIHFTYDNSHVSMPFSHFIMLHHLIFSTIIKLVSIYNGNYCSYWPYKYCVGYCLIFGGLMFGILKCYLIFPYITIYSHNLLHYCSTYFRNMLFIFGERNGNPFQYSSLWVPWSEETDGLQSMGSQRIRHNWVTEHEQIYILEC